MAGAPCRIRPGFAGAFSASSPGLPLREVEPGLFELGLQAGQEVILFQEAGDILPEISACVLPPRSANFFGVKDAKKALRPALSSCKPTRASSEWGAGFSAVKATDDDPGTRWGAAQNSRSGWLEVDLGIEQRVGSVEIWEKQFPRVQSFSIEVQQGETWREVARGTTVNGQKTVPFPPVTAQRVRLTVHRASDVPTLEEFRVLAPAAP